MTSDAAVPFQNALLGDKDEGIASSARAPVTFHSASDSPATIVANTRYIREHSDDDLLLQVGNGNKEALSILFQRHARAVHSVGRRILKDDSEAEDLVQELFLFIFQKAPTFDATKASGASWDHSDGLPPSY
jgi:RNA polymerase sigma-70 factor (ECF subfamily)